MGSEFPTEAFEWHREQALATAVREQSLPFSVERDLLLAIQRLFGRSRFEC